MACKRKKVLSPYDQLIKDGSIEYQKSRRGNYRDISRLISNYKCVIGVSKKFNPEKCVDRRGKSKASAIAQLPFFIGLRFLNLKQIDQVGLAEQCIWQHGI